MFMPQEHKKLQEFKSLHFTYPQRKSTHPRKLVWIDIIHYFCIQVVEMYRKTGGLNSVYVHIVGVAQCHQGSLGKCLCVISVWVAGWLS